MAKEVGMICEQGDLGLFYTPLNESDQKILESNKDDKKEGTTDGARKSSK